MSTTTLIQIGYLVAAVLFILGLKNLSRPKTAVTGNRLSAAGMLVAVVATMADRQIVELRWLALALALGTAIGAVLATRIAMTGMPQLVALFNGFGGLASLAVGAATVHQALDLDYLDPTDDLYLDVTFLVTTALTLAIGAITFTGSVVAFAKLQELMGDLRLGAIRQGGLAAVALTVAASAALVLDPSAWWVWLVVLVALAAGALLVVPIGGADMPVVIALLNSLSGLAASAAGFVLVNPLLIIAGALVGASGLLLTNIMCRAMNRTLPNVLFGSISAAGVAVDPDDVYEGRVTSTSADEVAMIVDSAQRVVIVPGYGLAVAQAQFAVRDLARALEQRGAEVVFAIHPVAGRMPGHMNVLLAEAEIDYDQLVEMDQVNPTFERTDVAIVIGANDVVNPDARENPQSPIAGMPILDVDYARTVVVIKRSLSPGFAGIPNPLFAADNTLMLYGDGKAAVEDITTALADL